MADNRANYYALVVSIINNCLPEQALAVMGGEVRPPSSAFAEEMKGHKDAGLTWKEVGIIFGLGGTSACLAVKRAGLG